MTLLGSGAILTEVIKAAEQLAAQGIEATVYSVTSWSELARDGAACQQRLLKGEAGADSPAEPFISALLQGSQGPIVAATDYVRAGHRRLWPQRHAGRVARIFWRQRAKHRQGDAAAGSDDIKPVCGSRLLAPRTRLAFNYLGSSTLSTT